jgi:hypothetical protein
MKKYITEILDSEDGSGDGILQFPPEMCQEEDWREGDQIHIRQENGSLILRNLSKEERENLSK